MTATPKQQTIAGVVSIEGHGVHTGEHATVRIAPAEPDSGIRFVRTDLPEAPDIPATLEHVVSTEKCTVLGRGGARVLTVEHLLAAVHALELDNVRIDVDGPELPILDGSFDPYFAALADAGRSEQERPAKVLAIRDAVTATGPADARYAAMPAEILFVSCTIDYPHPMIGRQHGTYEVVGDAFASDIARARTFGFMKDAEALHSRGLARGASLDNALILSESGLLSGELRYDDEFVRHKVGDLVGDLALLGRRVNAHILAARPSHGGNVALARSLLASETANRNTPIMDIQKIMQVLPHRYPFLLVDRVVEFEAGKRIVGIKNVTINEPFFEGHYPGHPIMPGVLIMEAMAQVGGLLVMDTLEEVENKVVYFMSMDNVKWRRPVVPGDQIRFEIDMLQLRRNTCRMKGVGLVDGKVAAEAEFMARIVDR